MIRRGVLALALVFSLAPACVPVHYVAARVAHKPSCPPITLALLDFGLVFAAGGLAIYAASTGHTTGAAIDSSVAASVAVSDTWVEEVCAE